MNNCYICSIKDSTSTHIYRSLYINGVDILKGGCLSCAFFVSSILVKFKMIEKTHATVRNTVRGMKDFGWKKVKLENIRKGDVIVWEKKKQDDEKSHFHIGFYIGDKKAISNSWYRKSPWKHSYNYNRKRKIISVFTFFD